MPDAQISLAEDEVIARVYFRYSSERGMFAHLRPKDFARVMSKHSGISLLRLKYLSKQEALDWVPSRKFKGLAICTAGSLVRLGLCFMAPSSASPHISTRCALCNLCVNCPEICTVIEKGPCLLDIDATPTLAETLHKQFKVDIPVTGAN